MTWTRTIAAVAIVAAVALAAQALEMLDIGRVEAGQSMSQSRLIGYQVTFQISQNPRTAGTTDQLTIVFANRSVEGPRVPRPFFGDDIVQEFSFSGVDFVNSQLRFTRRVSDKSFLEARYIRVVNYGSNSWDGEQIAHRRRTGHPPERPDGAAPRHPGIQRIPEIQSARVGGPLLLGSRTAEVPRLREVRADPDPPSRSPSPIPDSRSPTPD